MAGAVPGIVVLALGAGALGVPEALRLLVALAGRHPAVDIAVCVFVLIVFAAQLLGAVLLARFVRKAPPAGGDGAGRGAPAADPLACMTLLLSLAMASLVTACLVGVAGGPASVRPLVDLAAKYCVYPIAITTAGAALLYATPVLRVLREQRNARGGRAAPAERAATTRHAARFISLPLLAVAAVCALLVAIPFGAAGGLDAFRLSMGYANAPVAVAVGATLLVLVRFFRRARNAAAGGAGDAAHAPAAARRAPGASAR